MNLTQAEQFDIPPWTCPDCKQPVPWNEDECLACLQKEYTPVNLTQSLETRHYIGVTELGRLHMTLGPNLPSTFRTPPTEPLTLGNGQLLYPVSAEVAAEWDLDEDDDEDREDEE